MSLEGVRPMVWIEHNREQRLESLLTDALSELNKQIYGSKVVFDGDLRDRIEDELDKPIEVQWFEGCETCAFLPNHLFGSVIRPYKSRMHRDYEWRVYRPNGMGILAHGLCVSEEAAKAKAIEFALKYKVEAEDEGSN